MALVVTVALGGLFVLWPAGRARADTLVTTCTTTALQAALNAGGTVTFNCGTIVISPTLVVSSSVTVDGGNLVTLDGQGATRILSVATGAALTLTNISLVNGLAADGAGGGAVHVAGGGPLVANSATFAGHRAAGTTPFGGAIGGEVGSRVVVSGSTLLSNTAEYGGAINAQSVTMIGSLFNNNQATFGSGGAVHANVLTATATTVLSNRAEFTGGGLAAIEQATVSESNILSNSAGTSGGGIVTDRGTISGTRLVSNTATASGGGIYATGALSVSGSFVELNRAGQNGGGLYATSGISISSSSIMSNTTTIDGGGVYAGGAATVIGTAIVSNSATTGGGLWALRATITDTTILRNSSGFGGGGVLATVSAIIAGSIVMSNTTGGGGGGVYSQDSIAATRSTVVGNQAVTYGGGLAANDLVTIDSSTLTRNAVTSGSTNGGGAVSAQKVHVANSTIFSNTSAFKGGGVVFCQQLGITNSTFADNRATTGGNAVSFQNAGPGCLMAFGLVVDTIISGPGPLCTLLTTILSGTNVIGDSTCDGSASANIPLGPLQDNGGPTWTMAPLPGNPAIEGAGSCLPADQRGLPRTAPCDVGAYETGAGSVLTVLTPSAATALDPPFVQAVQGTGFIPGSVVLWNGSTRPTTVVSATLLTAEIPAADLTTIGVVTVSARYGLAADSLSNSLPFTIIRRSQAIAFDPLPDRRVLDPPFALSATASSGLPVVLQPSGQCQLTGITVTVTAPGSCSIVASQAGNEQYFAATQVVRGFTINKALQSITFSPLPDRALGDPPFVVSATASSGLPVILSASGPCSLAGTTVTLNGLGTCIISAIQGGNATYESVQTERSFTISAPAATGKVITLPAVGKDRPLG